MNIKNSEILFVNTAESEHVEMYLKAMWCIKERAEKVKVSAVANILHVKQPSAVHMLKKLNNMKLATYKKGQVEFTSEGENIARRMIRNSRLLEVMMKNALKIDIDEEIACGVEHHMKTKFTDALCTLLKHPRKCPHGCKIPEGPCCENK